MARIALAEDNPHLRKLLTTLLSLKGHEVSAFENGALALEAVLGGDFAMVLSDINMPELDGLSLCRALRERFSKEELPIILLSVLGSEDDILNGFDAGASDYLVKPFSTKTVQAKVALFLKRRMVEAPRVAAQGPLLKEPTEFPFVFDKYSLDVPIGRGSYGNVYLARRLADDLKVAVKLLAREVNDDRENLARYFREVALLSSMDSPHIVRFVDSGFERGRYFLGMELLDGVSTLERLQRQGPLTPELVARIGRDMCQALVALGHQGLIHRDLKPANIMLRKQDDSAVLIDFGLAKANRDQTLTHEDDFLGTAEYIAPEVISGERESVGSDMFSLGVTLYELVTDVAPFHAKTTYEVLMRIASGVPAEPANRVRYSIPSELSELIERLMEPDPTRRLTDPEEGAREFGALLSG